MAVQYTDPIISSFITYSVHEGLALRVDEAKAGKTSKSMAFHSMRRKPYFSMKMRSVFWIQMSLGMKIDSLCLG